MDEVIYVIVNWNKEEDRVEVEPSSVELTDAVEWVAWIAGGLPPRPDLAVRFQSYRSRGPLRELAVYPASVWGSGNRGPRRKAGANHHAYEVTVQTPDGPRCGQGLVINRATRPKPAKPRGGHPETPLPPSGPPDARAQRSGTTDSVTPQGPAEPVKGVIRRA